MLGEEIGILSVWLVVFLGMCLLSDRFRMYSNIRILLLNGSVIAFLALGQAFVLLTGGIDLSTGSTVGMTGVLCAVMMQLGLPWPLASLVALASGAFLGLLNGAIIHYLKIPPFIVTFSTYGVATSVPMIIAEAQSIQQGICALALNGVKSGPAAAEAAAAYKAGIPVFTVNVIVSEKDLAAQHAEIVDYVGADNFAGGKQIGEQVLKDYGPDAKLVIGIVTEPNEIPTVQRSNGFKSVFSDNPNVKIVQEVNGLVKPDVSLQKTTEMLQAHPDINLIWADTGPAAQGALRAVKSLNSNAKVYGFAISEYPIEPLYPAAAAQEPYEYAKITLKQIRDYLDGKDVPKQVLRPLKIITHGKPAPGEVG